MDTVNAHATDMMAQVAELLTLSLDLFAADSIGGEDADSMTQGLEQYMQQVGSMATCAEMSGEMGLYRICHHYHMLLAPLVHGAPLSEDARIALEEWPTLMMTYLEMPGDPDLGAALVEHLQNPIWATPLAEDAAAALLHLLAPSATVSSAAQEEAYVPETLLEAAPDHRTLPGLTEDWSEAEQAALVLPAAADDSAMIQELVADDAALALPEDAEPAPEAPAWDEAMEATPALRGLDGEQDAVEESDLAAAALAAPGFEDMPLSAAPQVLEEPPPVADASEDDDTLMSIKIPTEEEILSAAADTPVEGIFISAEIYVQNEMLTAADTPGLEDAVAFADAPALEETATVADTPEPEDTLGTAETMGMAYLDEALADVETPDSLSAIATPEATDAADMLAAYEQPEIADELLDTSATTAWRAEVAYEEDDAADEAIDAANEAVDEAYEDVGEDEDISVANAPALAGLALDSMEIDASWAGEMDETTRSLVALLCQETLQLAESLGESLTDDAMASDAWRQALTDHSEELERFGEGAAAMGLEGLQMASTHLCVNLLQLIAQEEPLSDTQRQMVQSWTTPVLHYLQGLHDPATHEALLQYLDDARWPDPLSAADRATLQELLPNAQLSVGDEEPMPERQREARLADISLSLPEDVVPELLDTLLQELPQQAADFSTAIQRLSTGAGTLADVTVAQRIAHSLKGAANTVGVPGVANLTHHLEDILLAFAQHDSLPTPPLSRTLTNAADCLEAMSEALSGAGEVPPVESTLGILQEVLDWANLIDEDGVPQDDTTCPPVRDTLPGLLESDLDATADAEAAPTRTATASSGTRMGTEMVDELLRMSGEGTILNGQLQDRLKRTFEQTRMVRAQNTIVQQLVWDLEQLVDIRGVTSPLLQRTADGEFDPLEMEQYNELHTVSRRLLEAITDALTVGRDVESSLEMLDGLLHDQRRVQRESEEAIMRTRMVPVKTIAPRLQRGVRQACRLTGKEAEFVLNGGETLMDSQVLTGMLDPLMHMLRNAVDHGIEAPAAREAQGKPSSGTITLNVSREGNTIVLRCRDDGAGLNYEAIHRTAVARGLVGAQEVLSEEEMGLLILRPGFSTRTQTTQVSGRGIGMDVVYTRIQELKGSLRLTSEAGRGCLMEVRLPVSLMSTHGLLVRSGTQVFALSDLGIEQILYPTAGALWQDGEAMAYQLGNESLEATTLEALLNLHTPGTVAQLATRPALLVRDAAGRRRIVLVQAVLDSLVLVIKPLGRYVPPIPGVAGATILGDGSATPVLDLPELFTRLITHGQMPVGALQETVRLAERALPVALVVDDSLSARRALADFVQDLGFEVHTAGDGLEAIASMERQMPAILLVDLEMPRMNGLELAEHVRVHHSAEELPIIMVTSRSTEKHRRTAARSGVNVYLVKPFPEDTLAEHIHQLTAARGAAMHAA